MLRGRTSLRIGSDRRMGLHYAHTLREWRARFAAAGDELDRLGFGPAFRRMWELYLAYCEGGFLGGYLDLHQFGLERTPS